MPQTEKQWLKYRGIENDICFVFLGGRRACVGGSHVNYVNGWGASRRSELITFVSYTMDPERKTKYEVGVRD